MTAEFVTAMPAVILVLVFCLAGVQLVTGQLRLQDAASGAARAASRGTATAEVGQRVAQLVPGASVRQSVTEGVVCVTVTLPATLGQGLASAVTLRATGCALAEGS